MRASGYGSGWHGETLRHSRARRLGRAGGTYADINKLGISQFYKKMSKEAIKEKERLKPVIKYSEIEWEDGQAHLYNKQGTEVETFYFDDYILDYARKNKLTRYEEEQEDDEVAWYDKEGNEIDRLYLTEVLNVMMDESQVAKYKEED